MKTLLNTKGFVILLTVVGFSFLVMACSKENNNDDNTSGVHYGTLGDATGAEVTPPVSTTGTATMAGTYATGTNKWEYSISWSSLSGSATAIEIHGPAIPGQNGELVFSVSIEGGGSNGAKSVLATLTEAQETDLLASKYYFTVLTTAHPAGEVRGQVLAITR